MLGYKSTKSAKLKESAAMDDAREGMKPPAAVWWRQRSVLWTEVAALVIVGIAVVTNFLPGSRYWIGLLVGALLALALTFAVGGLFTIHDTWEAHRRFFQIWQPAAQRDRRDRLAAEARAENAFGLGYAVSQRPSDSVEIAHQWRFLRAFCQELSLPLESSDLSLMRSSPRDLEDLVAASAVVRRAVEEFAPREWWCFFHLGAIVAWLTDKLDNNQSIHLVRQELEAIQTAAVLRDDERYASSVDRLIDVLSSVDGPKVAAETRPQIVRDVNEVLAGLPSPQVEMRQTPFPVPVSSWFWTETDGVPGAMCFVGDRSIYHATSSDSFEIETSEDNEGAVQVFRDPDGWRCSVHGKVSETMPCPDLDLILSTTDGGQPITHARLILVRSDETPDPDHLRD